ncbi:Rieske (2Fe-2S) protein [Streptomyces griseoviridis]|uniref:Cytochrome bc1 complex Rieske iron-sulfur subunit n=2 Tax=Streptomyces TaxID=1883 RepID=A0A3S9ZL08_STRGD|nr:MULTISPECIES: Rieske (2Fe-2S) protein [Streptomyces]AZS88550.1 Rieske (2Fe-2S) protein [Streptomyces griseoviridis]MDH6697165.1 nitrite reductase/ring-hydroxylating ferredoxin subunit [Streptomyces sp. MAA16]MDT0473952.1 Rieske (2Fe-2S) protein [Streptomyces sp. DSM 41014]QCN84610.1 iron-sulfur protein [Streptomyces griseoviridis]
MTSESLHPLPAPTRRTVVAAVGAAGLAVALTACGSGDDSSASAGASLGRTTDIPEGGGKIFKDEGVVVTQPTAGTFKAFSAKCTHQGCAVTSVADGVIVCPCHKSHFSVEDGSVKQGPATQALPAAEIKVSGDSITLA